MKLKFATAALMLFSSTAIQAANYTILDIGSLSSGATSPYGINSNGYVVGNSGTHGFLYQNGAISDLGTVAGDSSISIARDINASGQIVGNFGASGDHAFLYSAGVLTNICDGYAYGMNNTGQVVGAALRSSGPGGSYPFLYSNGTLVNLSDAPGGNSASANPFGNANDVNNNGQVVGNMRNGSNHDAPFLYSGGTVVGLGSGRWRWLSRGNQRRRASCGLFEI